jgi:NADH-quinone oxidoreductase subunit C/D
MAVTAPAVIPTTSAPSAPNLNDPLVVAEKIKAALPDAGISANAQGISVDRNKIVEVMRFVRDDAQLGLNYLANVTSVDFPDRIEVVYHLASVDRGGSPVTLRVNADKQEPVVPSVVSVFRGADFQEREVYDMMGVRFTGHPNLRRILMWEGFEGFPLRKDYHEPYYEEEHKPFGTRWDQGHHVIAEDRNPWHDNVQYPANFDAPNFKPARDPIRSVGIEEAQATSLRTDKIVVNIGPQHPSTHGVLRLRATLDGETVVAVEPVLGYLHRNHEKIGERNTYMQNMPFTDRLDYLTSMSNNLAYAITVEKLMGLKVPERAEYIRVIVNELTRFVSHLALVGFFYSDLGAYFTPVLYGLEERELVLDLFEAVSGSRMMCNYMRFGGVARDLPAGWLDTCRELVFNRFPRVVDEFQTYLVKNELFNARSKGVGILPRDVAINYSAAGPVLRASGVKYDLRKADPYSIYNRFDFDIPVGTNGDVYDRFVLRLDEMRQSLKILKQALDQIPEGEIQTGKKNYQVRVPKGDVYGRAENPKGELAFYVVSDGSPNPYRYHVRSPAFINLGILNEMSAGYKLQDLIIILGAIDLTMGEVDR